MGNGRFVESVVQVRVVKSFVMELSELLFYGKKRRSIEHQTKSQSKEWHRYDIYRRLALNVIFTGITAIIIYCSAASLLIRNYLELKQLKKDEKLSNIAQSDTADIVN